jgi:hypothetical protein
MLSFTYFKKKVSRTRKKEYQSNRNKQKLYIEHKQKRIILDYEKEYLMQ